MHVFARVVCSFYWFHPLAWQAWRRLHVEADRSCDDAVADCGNPSEFAEQLVALATRIVSIPPPALSMAGGELVTRVHALLNPNQARGRSGARYAMFVAASAIVVGTSVAAVEPVHRTTFERVAPIQPPAATFGQQLSSSRPPVAVPPRAAQASAPAPTPPPPSAAVTPISQPRNPAATAPTRPPDYVIGAGDILIVSYWNHKEMTSEVLVRPDGRITLPLINDVDAAGLTPGQLRDRLMQASVKFLADPAITVGVKAINSRKVYISGGVAKPGPYDLVDQMTVMSLIAAAGGLRDFVTGRKILIIRRENGKQIALPFDYRDVLSGQNLDQNIVLEPGDLVVVPE